MDIFGILILNAKLSQTSCEIASHVVTIVESVVTSEYDMILENSDLSINSPALNFKQN